MTNRSDLSRRSFLQTSIATAGVAGVGLASTASAADPEGLTPLKPGAVVLFQGDSITDAGRNRGNEGPNNARTLGTGYPVLLAAELMRDHATAKPQIYNRGISGHKVPDLAARWQKDCLDLKPDVLSILVGVNDIWHKLNGNYNGTVETYETGYRELLKQTIAALPKTTIVVCEPFALKTGAVNDKWFPEMDQRRAVAKKLAEELKLTFVPFQSMFDEAIKLAPAGYWAGDGVHPSLAGHSLMAKTWRATTGI